MDTRDKKRMQKAAEAYLEEASRRFNQLDELYDDVLYSDDTGAFKAVIRMAELAGPTNKRLAKWGEKAEAALIKARARARAGKAVGKAYVWKLEDNGLEDDGGLVEVDWVRPEPLCRRFPLDIGPECVADTKAMAVFGELPTPGDIHELTIYEDPEGALEVSDKAVVTYNGTVIHDNACHEGLTKMGLKRNHSYRLEVTDSYRF